jgi:hypothetical protein
LTSSKALLVVVSSMSDAALKKLKAEKTKLEEELELAKTAWKTSDACKAICEFVKGTVEPFDKTDGQNPYTKKISGSSCLLL